jgi:hypothetical protein
MKEILSRLFINRPWVWKLFKKKYLQYLATSLNQYNDDLYEKLIDFNKLNHEQQDAIKLPTSKHIIISGPPRAGKTMILLHRAHFLHQAHKIPNNRLKIVVYNNVQKDYLRSLMEPFQLEKDTVLTIDHWCNAYYLNNISADLPVDSRSVKEKPDFDQIRSAVLNKLRSNNSSKDYTPEYDAILVDGGESLPPISFTILNIISRHITVSYYRSRIYDHGAGEDTIIYQLGQNTHKVALSHSYFENRHIAKLAASNLTERDVSRNFIAQTIAAVENCVPQLYCAKKRDDENRVLTEMVKKSLARGEKIGLLFFSKNELKKVASVLKKAKITAEVMRVRKGKKGEYVSSLHFDNSSPKLLTYFGARNVHFETVIMPYISKKRKINNIDELLFLGITRATKRVYMTTFRNLRRSYDPVIRMSILADNGHINVTIKDMEIT